MSVSSQAAEADGSCKMAEAEPTRKESRVMELSKLKQEPVPPWGIVTEEPPLDSLPTFLQEYVTSVSQGHSVPVQVPVLAALGTLSGAMGKGWRLSGVVPNKRNYGNLYIVGSLPPSSGKNSVEGVVAPFRDFEKRRRETWETDDEPRLFAAKESLEAKLKAGRNPKSKTVLDESQQADIQKKISKHEKRLKWCPDLLAGDDTSAHLIQKVQYVTDETLCVFSSEGGDIVQTMLGRFQDKGADLKFWLKGYSGDNHKSGRVHSGGVVIDEPILTVCIFVQPYVWDEIHTNKEADSCGLLPRFLVSQTFSPMPFDNGEAMEIPQTLTDEWNRRIVEILEMRVERGGDGHDGKNNPREVQCAPDAVEILRCLHNEAVTLANGPCADLRPDLGRWRENAARLALVLAVAENPYCKELTGELAGRAVKLFKWFAAQGFDTRKESRDEALESRKVRLEGLLKKNGNSLSLRMLEKNHSFSPQEIQQMAFSFPDRFRVEERKNATGGRPSNGCVLIEPAG